MRPTSSRGSAKMYLDSVMNKDAKKGTHLKADSKGQGNVSWWWLYTWDWAGFVRGLGDRHICSEKICGGIIIYNLLQI